MAGRVVEGVATRRRILATAERLFARNGIDGVSIRDIATAAKVNSAATHYHFGTKQDLVAAVLKTRVAELRERTLPILAAMEANGSPTVRQIAEALVRPIAEMGANYASFLIAVSDHPKYARLGSSEFEEPSLDLLHAFGKALPELPAEVAAYRFAVAQILANQALGNRRKRLLVWLQHLHPGGEVDYVEALIDFIAGGLAAPTVDDGHLASHGAGRADAAPPKRAKRPAKRA
jgi:AcrR family transcriptional regulator